LNSLTAVIPKTIEVRLAIAKGLCTPAQEESRTFVAFAASWSAKSSGLFM